VLRSALDAAVRDQLLAHNPVAAVKRPGVPRREAAHLDAAGVTKLLATADQSRHHCALVVIASTGLRRGEVLALRWRDVDLDAGVLTVRGTAARVNGKLTISPPKTTRSRWVVPLSPAVVTMLRKHRKTQITERLRAGDQWTDTGLVFTNEFGGLVDPQELLRAVKRAAKAVGLEGVSPHTLRNSAATRWLEAGVHIKAVSDLLGHSSVAITGDTYGHTSDTAARSAVVGLAQSLGLWIPLAQKLAHAAIPWGFL
jgi:integrase